MKARRHAPQPESSDGSPTDELDQPVGGIGVRGDQHGAAGVLAVVECQEQTASLIPLFVRVAAQREGSAAQLRDAHKNAEQITEMAQRFEVAIRKRTDVRGEAHTEKIEGINLA